MKRLFCFKVHLMFFLSTMCVSVLGQGLIVNGSFEQSDPLEPMLDFPMGSTGITGWTVINVNYLDSSSADPDLV